MNEELQQMEVGDRIRMDVWDVWRMPTGWVITIDGTDVSAMTSVFVPDVLNVEVGNYTK
jgi:hypothetical protein